MKKCHKRPQNDVLRIEQDVRQLLLQDKRSEEIMSILKISERTLRRYTARINLQNREQWNFLVRNELESELLKLRSSLTQTYRFCQEKLKDGNIESSELREWLHEKDTARINLVKILTDYPRMPISNDIPEDDIDDTEDEESEPEEQSKALKKSRDYIERRLSKK